MEAFGLATIEDWHVGGQTLKVWGQKVGESEVRGINRKVESKYRVNLCIESVRREVSGLRSQ